MRPGLMRHHSNLIKEVFCTPAGRKPSSLSGRGKRTCFQVYFSFVFLISFPFNLFIIFLLIIVIFFIFGAAKVVNFTDISK